jgi:ABC-type transport system involved in multi-copper enzyme maturation permease subunit
VLQGLRAPEHTADSINLPISMRNIYFMRILVLAQDEVMRLLSTRRGLIALVGFLLIWVAVLRYGILPAAALFGDSQLSALIESMLSWIGMEDVRNWPTPELAVYWVTTLYLLPFFALMASADQTASDRSRGTLRYLVLRCSRLEIFLGRFLGQCIIMLLVVLVTLGSVLLVIMLYSPNNLAAALAKMPLIVINLVLVVAPYIALMALVSVLARSARQATLYAFIIWISALLLVAYLRAKFGPLALLDWTLPGSQIGQLLRLSNWDTLSFAIIPIVHTALFLSIGAVLMRQRDL